MDETTRAWQVSKLSSTTGLRSCSNSTTSRQGMAKAYSTRSNLSSITGYSADHESSSDQGSSISSASVKKRICDEKIARASKRARLLEESFAAANAPEDIKRANRPLSIPKIGVNKNFMGGIDLTQVKHVVSSKYTSPVQQSHEMSDDANWQETVTQLSSIFVNVLPFYSMMVPEKKGRGLVSSSDSDAGFLANVSSRTCPIQVIV
mmetsp:Transcript_27456/g.39314  ORF Transcript_27456/g.39314 Transcript_27456/m.39314 type:complete len:206 (+) Transcript_27456:105-722(+)|eukprot:CAMPEP_0172424340 /NCGR_PEP_ID=MMETSP1064-20121228/24388_1 /TAXON_ID=202472 /ORGANISM="Aulacoseira subarctica , Strain CCAP 1002/5" /LENGTH=205 /DNA_ID=CAMNT_0013166343 /DNA_START=83 /DNA_END=700 /DNA_ORIENTATION=-